MVDIKTLLPELKKLVTELSEDLLKRVGENSAINEGLENAYKQIEKGGRTAQAYEVWLEDYLNQVAVAWVLGCVFVRFMEDNGLIEECYLAGDGDRRTQAENEYELYFRDHPHDSDREYFEHVFQEVGKIPAATDLFAEGKTPLWAVGPTGDAARTLLKFWQEADTDSGKLQRTFDVEDGDTRFLGDLYQELSERAKKKYALLQTPVFVEEFILDRTLTPAIDEFGLETVRMIDPTCGSGHFLLGGFARLFALWSKPEHTSGNSETDTQKALDGVWGVDVNPFAVAIARFRLIVAAVQACGVTQLRKAPGWKIHLATGDSLLFGKRFGKAEQQLLRPVVEHDNPSAAQEFWAPDIFACEDKEAISEVLSQQYHVVVGNPPYITVKDKSLNAAYRDRYSTCHQKYSLGVPFTERFFDLAVSTNEDRAGYVGMITANSFMKREFGKKLIEEFFPRVDLTHVIDTSGAYIPGHGTPTVILFGRSRKPKDDVVRAVLGIKGESSTPAIAAKGFVWTSIVTLVDTANTEDEFNSTSDVPRVTFAKHPWSMSGGGASGVVSNLTASCDSILSNEIASIGFMAITGEDEVFVLPTHYANRVALPKRQFCEGDVIRDWSLATDLFAIVPYDFSTKGVPADRSDQFSEYFWPFRTNLRRRSMFGKNVEEHGFKWFEFMQFIRDRAIARLSIPFAFVATHNHFVLDRGGKVFKQSAPIITLPDDATEAEHHKLAGLLNSSTACFWMKQTLHDKGGGGIGGGLATEFWEHFFEFTGTGLKRFPIPDEKPLELAIKLDRLSQEYATLFPDQIVQRGTPTEMALQMAETNAAVLRGQMIALQEELDWECYRLYGLHDENLRYTVDDLPETALSQRAFEIVMARQMAEGKLVTTWFERHGSEPITEYPADWPQAYCKVMDSRIAAIESNKNIRLIEQPEFKRRWNDEPWKSQQEKALQVWLLDRIESQPYWPDAETTLQTAAQLTDKASHDEEFNQVAALYKGRADFDLSELVVELVEKEAVPFLPILRYKAAGMRKHVAWERTWELQRQEDAGTDIVDIPVAPKYTTGDYQKSDYWRLRGKLDVPKERWVSYLHCEREGDPSVVVGWAGWNHLQQATALVAYYDARKREGWSAERLSPLLAGLDQLLPWIHQWHPEIDPEYNETAGTSFQTLLESEAQELGLTLEDIRNWTPPKKTKKGGRRKASKGGRKKAEG